MPELPEVETVRLAVARFAVGRRITAVAVRDGALREPVDLRQLRRWGQGQLLGARRRGKYLLLDIEGGAGGGVILIHLGMTGRLSLVPAETPAAKHDRVSWRLDDGRELRLNDARRFGLVAAFAAAGEAEHPRLRHLGVEPLSPEFTPEAMRHLAAGLRAPVKSFIMDAKRVVGVGNIYACEALHGACIHPTRPVGGLSLARWGLLVGAVGRTLTRAIAVGGTTLQDFAGLTGEPGYFAISLEVYDRAGEPCGRCGRTILRRVLAGRGTFYCPGCQR